MVQKMITLDELGDEIEESLRNRDGWEYKEDSLRISEVPYCHRKSFIYRKFNTSPRLNGLMLSGTMFHNKLEKILKNIPEFKDAKFEPKCEVDLGKFRLRGRVDVVTKDKTFEFKYSASSLKKGIPEHYIIQSNAYANIMGKKKHVLSYINSYSLKPTLMEFDADKKLYNETIKNAKKLYKCLKENEFPEGPRWDWECKYCNVKSKCKELRELQEYKDLPEFGVVP